MSSQKSSIAYRLKPRSNEFTGEAAGHLPLVECEFCAERAGGVGVAFPLVQASDFSDVTWKLNITKLKPSVCSWTQFEGIIERGRRLSNDPTLELVPNSSLGPIEIEPIGLWPKDLNDMDIANPGGLLFSRHLIEKLRTFGIDPPFQSAILKNRKGFSYPYGIMQPQVYRIMHPETFVQYPKYQQCSRCGEIKVLKPGKGPERLYLRSEFRQSVASLFRVIGYVDFVFVSDRMKAALDEIQPSGLAYDPFGCWME